MDFPDENWASKARKRNGFWAGINNRVSLHFLDSQLSFSLLAKGCCFKESINGNYPILTMGMHELWALTKTLISGISRHEF